ncbi:MAG: DUF4249 domain-containing protein [Bacteroidales bacterium]|nr:DUF4249 domain-containing protein [Bacteroidales bacterium]
MKKIIILSVAIILIITACEKKLDIDIPEGEKHIVVNGIINADSLLTVSVSKSQNILDNDDISFLADADIKLYSNDIFVENLLHVNSGVYISTVVPDISVNYKINVDYDNLKSVNADMILHNPVEIVSVDTVVEVHTNSNGEYGTYQEYEIHYKIKIEDDGNTNDYYFLALSLIQPLYEYDEYGLPTFVGYEEINEYFNTNDPAFRDNNEFTLDGMFGSVFTDELFNGTQYTVNISTGHFFDDYDRKLDGEEYLIKVKLLTVTEDIYRYITSYNLNQKTKYDPFAQPVQIYSNIENGLGLFSGYTMDVDSLVLNF